MRAASLLVVAAACTSAPPYQCQDNSQCIDDNGASGICEQDNFCSFHDTTCSASTQRYASGAGNGKASQCVEASADACITQIAVGIQFSCYLRMDGTVWCWGNNADGEVGAGVDPAYVAVPTKVSGLSNVVEVSTAEEHACALEHDGSVWCWGINDTLNLGQCNGGSIANSKTPVKVPTWTANGTMPTMPTCNAGTAFLAALPSATAVSTLSAGGEHTCAVSAADSKLYCWGEDSTSPGDGGQSGQDPDVFTDNVPGPLVISGAATLGAVTDLQSGDEYTCASNGKDVYCFGQNDIGELATGNTTGSFMPTKIGGFGDVGQLAVDDETGCILTKNGNTVYCWGNGSTGIFGPVGNDSNNSLTAVNLGLTASNLFGGSTTETLCMSSQDGSLKCWGDNTYGQIGNGDLTNVDVSTPTTALLSSVTQMRIGDHHACALTQDGSLWCWGDNSVGELGGNMTSSMPVAVPTRVAVTCQ